MPSDGGNALLLALGIVALSFIAEDGATLLAVGLAGNGLLRPELAFVACFAGIWIGDLGLYGAARWLRGHPRLASSQRLLRAERWFRAHGNAALVITRFIPGTRAATYATAGVLRTPVAAFAIITGLCAALWVGAAFALARHVGLGELLTRPVLVGTGAAAIFVWLTRTHAARLFTSARRLVRKYSRWEFWPAWLFYLPVVLMCARLALKYGGLTLPTVANPSQHNGGIIGESKFQILLELRRHAPEFVAPTYLIPAASPDERFDLLRAICTADAITPPFVLKPDTAQRGAGFRKIGSFAEAAAYLSQVKAPVVLQRYAPGPHEAGIFYYRFPHKTQGHIFAITRKVFPTVTGDGERTLEQLILADERASLIAPTYLRRFPELAPRVIPAGAVIRLVEAGNHCQGCIFEDGADLASEELRAAFDRISQNLSGFFIGRYDVRYGNQDELRAGRAFTIVELNGAASEATSIYDAHTTLRDAYGMLYRQWELVYAIGAANRARGAEAAGLKALWCDWRHYQRQAALYPAAD
jgi:membrane protein DedA with SNARE-associated domain